jgi:hypothetical protein
MKNLELLTLASDQLELLQTKIDLHRRYSAIGFRIVSVSDTEMILSIHQDKSFHENKFDHVRLREIAHETFDPFIGTRKLHVSIKVDVSSPPDIVTPGWIKKKMLDKGIKIKDIVSDTGIDKSTISSYINEHKPLSHVTKAMFFYYFN